MCYGALVQLKLYQYMQTFEIITEENNHILNDMKALMSHER